MDFPLYFQILLGQWQGVILEIPYGCFRVFSPFLPNKHRQGGFFFRFEDGPSKLIPYLQVVVPAGIVVELESVRSVKWVNLGVAS